MDARLTVLLTLRTETDGSLVIAILPVTEGKGLKASDSSLDLTFWSERPGLIRGRFRHVSSGAAAHFQGAEEPFRALATALDLSMLDLSMIVGF